MHLTDPGRGRGCRYPERSSRKTETWFGGNMHQTTPRILVVDDQSDVLAALRILLKGEGFEVETHDSPAAAIRAVEENVYDAALIDLNYTRDTTSGQEGLNLLSVLRASDPRLPVVVMTAWG